MIDPQDSFLRNSMAIAAPVDDQVVALDIESGSCFGLNPVAAVIWEKLESAISVDALVSDLRQSYDIDEETCTAEVSALLEELLDCKLIVRV